MHARMNPSMSASLSLYLLVFVGTSLPAAAQATAPNEWTWIGGSSTPFQSGMYGTLGTPDTGNIPGARCETATWADKSGNFWFFGGLGDDSTGVWGSLNDLWEFNPATGQWTWEGGSKTVGPNFLQPGVYGTPGTPAAGNIPGGRSDAASWTDRNGNFWLFGGNGADANGIDGVLNDVWKFNPTTGEWAWMGGSSEFTANPHTGQAGVYGTLGSPSSGNIPGGRDAAASWVDASGNFWLFGGLHFDESSNNVYLNDLWEFNPSTNEWAWMGGSNTGGSSSGQPGIYGVPGTPAAGNLPGGRMVASSWTDSSGNLWLFGGSGFDASGNIGDLNDLWEFNPSTREWAWMGGSNTLGNNNNDRPGVYGTPGTPAAGNIPGGRGAASNWTDSSGHLWLFGGYGSDASGDSGDLNDLWEFNPSTGEWTWMGGTSASGQPGNYGMLGNAAAGNLPSARNVAATLIDLSGNFWLFGGYVSKPNNQFNLLNDLWVYEPPASIPPAMPTLTMNCTPNPVGYHQQLTCSSTVSGDFGGTIAFTINGNLWTSGAPNSGGTFSASRTVGVTGGSYTVAANYSGDTNYAATSSSVIVTAEPATPTLSINCTPNPVAYHQQLTCSSTVSGDYGGTIAFSINGNAWTSGAPNGSGTFSAIRTVGVSSGSYTVAANYSGDTDYAATNASVIVTAEQATPTLSINCTPNPVAYHQQLTCSSTASGDYGGTIAFTINGTPWTSGAPNGSGTFSASRTVGVTGGSYTVAANYSGDTYYAATTASIVVTAEPATPTMSMNCTPNPVQQGQVLTCTSTVSGDFGGTIAFTINGGLWISGVPDGSGTFSATRTVGVSGGTYTVAANYSGDIDYAAISNSVQVTAEPAAP